MEQNNAGLRQQLHLLQEQGRQGDQHAQTNSTKGETKPKLKPNGHKAAAAAANGEKKHNWTTIKKEAGTSISCSPAQIAVIRNHLPPDECMQNQKRPWNRKCSFSAASCCPQNIWLHKFYERVHTHNISSPHSFVGLSVGCNRGDDAINLMRLGSADPSFDTDRWSAAFFANSSSIAGEVCGQALPQIDLGNSPQASGASQMHCIDPLKHNANALRRSAHELGLDTKGFHVHEIAISKTNGAVLFPSAKATKLGTENKGTSKT